MGHGCASLSRIRRDDCRERCRERRLENLPWRVGRTLVFPWRSRCWARDHGHPMTARAMAPVPTPERRSTLPLRTQAAIFLRLLAIQGSWNYEILLGNGIGFCLEPALRLLPEGIHSDHFKQALARQSKYFNAHPYLASVAVGALARAELDGEPAARIERFRTALAGPLGSVGDRLVWAGWLPLCSLAALTAFGLGAGSIAVLVIFLGTYNIGQLALRAWGL